MTLKKAFDRFVYEKRLKGLSDMSIYDYKILVGLFVGYTGPDSDICSINREGIESYIEYHLERGLSRSTLATYVRNLKIFLIWLECTYNIDLDASSIIVPKTPKTMPYIYSSADIALIFQNVTCEIEWLQLRNRSMIALMLDSGLRQSEICQLSLSDIDFHTGIIKVHGKGNKERLVPLGDVSKQFIRDYMRSCPYSLEHLFVSRIGEPVTPNTLKKMIGKIARKLPFELSCHKLRHNFATNYCLDQYDQYGKIDIYSLMSIMGHENIKTTERYMHIATQILASKQHISHLDRILA